MLKIYSKKINIINLNSWHHHNDGWNYILNKLKFISKNNGISFYTNGIFNQIRDGKIIKEPWIGICHFALEEIKKINFKDWKESLSNCKGIFVHAEVIKKQIEDKVPCPVVNIIHPAKTPKKFFNIKDFNKNEIFFFWKMA